MSLNRRGFLGAVGGLIAGAGAAKVLVGGVDLAVAGADRTVQADFEFVPFSRGFADMKGILGHGGHGQYAMTMRVSRDAADWDTYERTVRMMARLGRQQRVFDASRLPL